MSIDIHVGIRREDTLAFQRILVRETGGPFARTKSDNWHTWEPFPGEETEEKMQQEVVHLSIETLTPMIMLNFLVNRMGVFLNQLEDENSQFNGRFIIVTDHDHWDQYYVELSYPE